MYVCTYVCIYVYAQFACMYVYSILEVLGIVLGIGSMYVYLCLYVCMLAIYRYVVLIHNKCLEYGIDTYTHVKIKPASFYTHSTLLCDSKRLSRKRVVRV